MNKLIFCTKDELFKVVKLFYACVTSTRCSMKLYYFSNANFLFLALLIISAKIRTNGVLGQFVMRVNKTDDINRRRFTWCIFG